MKYFLLPACLVLLLFVFSCSNNGGDVKQNSIDSLTPTDIAELNKKILDDPDNASLYHERSKAYLKNKKLQEALSDLQRALKVDSTKSDFYITLADIYLAGNKTKGTKEALEKCISIDPKNTQALLKLAELLYFVEHYDESLSYLDEALKIDQYNAKAYFIKGMNFLGQGDTNKAISTMQTAVEQDQNYYTAYMLLGLLHAEKGNKLALEYYNNALRIQPHSTEAMYDIGKFYQDIKEWDNAISAYNSLLLVDSNYKFAHYNLGAIELLTTKKYDKALVNFQNAVRADSRYVEAYFAMGTCYEAMGNKKKALEGYSLALQIDPNYEPALTAASALQK